MVNNMKIVKYGEEDAVCEECGSDLFVCQVCEKNLCSVKYPPVWNTGMYEGKVSGNICPACNHKEIAKGQQEKWRSREQG